MKFFVVLSILLVLPFIYCQTDLSLDGYYYPSFEYLDQEGLYLETWYYNFYDPNTDIKGTIVFGVDNPGNKNNNPSIYSIDINIVVNNEMTNETLTFSEEEVSLSESSADISMDTSSTSGTVTVKDEDHYQINIQSMDYNIQLFYTRNVTTDTMAINPLKNVSIGDADFKRFTYVSFFPSVGVSGSITIKENNTVIHLSQNARGFHDHWFWTYPVSWYWFQTYNLVNEEPNNNNAVICLDMIDVDMGFMFLFSNNQTSYFTTLNYDLNMKYNNGIPDGGRILARNGYYNLYAVFQTDQNIPVNQNFSEGFNQYEGKILNNVNYSNNRVLSYGFAHYPLAAP